MKEINNLRYLKKVLSKWIELKGNDKLVNMMLEKSEGEEIPKNKRNIYPFYNNIIAIIPKNSNFEKYLLNNFDLEARNMTFDYITNTFKEISGIYNIELLNNIWKTIKKYERAIIKLKPDYPLWIEVMDFVIILAPIQEGEELQ